MSGVNSGVVHRLCVKCPCSCHTLKEERVAFTSRLNHLSNDHKELTQQTLCPPLLQASWHVVSNAKVRFDLACHMI